LVLLAEPFPPPEVTVSLGFVDFDTVVDAGEAGVGAGASAFLGSDWVLGWLTPSFDRASPASSLLFF